MAKVAKYISKIKDGKITAVARDAIIHTLKLLEGKVVQITIAAYQKKRSVSQNNYYWTVIVPEVKDIFIEGGQIISDDEAHQILKKHIGKLGRTINLPNGTEDFVPGSTTKYSTTDWEIYMELCRGWCAKHGRLIPLPNERL